MRIVVLGVTGMLGHAMFRTLSRFDVYEVFGTARAGDQFAAFSETDQQRLLSPVDAGSDLDIVRLLDHTRPDVVVNCIGVIKQIGASKDPLRVMPLNAIFPHKLAQLCKLTGTRVIHISTDCVFEGSRGQYLEADVPDARDLYGLSKLVGELGAPNVTLRTSIVGHELRSSNSLIDWFLSQRETVKGYTAAYFSGLPTPELARVVAEYVIPQPDLAGLYHVSAERISKFDLLKLVGEIYERDIRIVPDGSLKIDRSLDSSRFRTATGYCPADWRSLITSMRDSQRVS